MIRLAGRVPGEDVEIRYTGLRPGEKLYEELFHDQEALAGTAHEKILLARHRAVEWSELVTTLDEMAAACARYDAPALSAALQRLVPEFEGSAEGQSTAHASAGGDQNG